MTTAAERAAAKARREKVARDKARRKARLDKAHAAYVLRTYGVDYAALLAAQGGRCAICRALPRTMRLHVDHDHAKQREGRPIAETVRGLLCKRCNHDGLGAFHDDATLVLRAWAYLTDPPAQKTLDRGRPGG